MSDHDPFKELSVFARNVCRNANIQNRGEVLRQLNTGEFEPMKYRNCGIKTTQELYRWCGFDNSNRQFLSTRAKTVLRHAKITDETHFQELHSKGMAHCIAGKQGHLNYCGTKTYLELCKWASVEPTHHQKQIKLCPHCHKPI